MPLILQIGHGARGDVTILPTFVVNNRQYRGVSTLPLFISFQLNAVYVLLFFLNVCLFYLLFRETG